MKKRLLALLLTLHLVQIFSVITFRCMPKPITVDYQIPALAYCLFGLLLLSVVLATINIIHGFKGYKTLNNRETAYSFGAILAFKIGFIPFFAITFAAWAFFALATMNPLLIFLWLLIPFGIGYSYFMLLATSSYTIPHMIRLMRSGRITKGKCALHVILQLLFVTDVIGSAVFFGKYRKYMGISD
jgi:hypothetical protein